MAAEPDDARKDLDTTGEFGTAIGTTTYEGPWIYGVFVEEPGSSAELIPYGDFLSVTC